MKEALYIILREQAKTQERVEEAYELFRDVERDDADYNKIASDYYYKNGMNNELIIIRNLIESEMNKNE